MAMTKVKELVKQVRGVSYKPGDLHNELNENSVILLRANNIDDGQINFDDVVYVDKSKVSAEQYLKTGDILICASSGSRNLVGKAASVQVDKKCTFGAFCKVVRSKEGFEEYLGVYFQSPIYRRKISDVALGANINNIRNEHIDSLDIPVHSKMVQEVIVKKIHLLQEIISNRKAELVKLDELIKARFVEMFGDPKINDKCWDSGRVSDFYEVKGGKRIPKGMGYADGITAHPYLRATDMKNETILDDDIHYIDNEVYEHIKRYTVKAGDIYLTNVGVNLGMAGVIPDKYDGANLTENAVKLVPKTEKVIDGRFLAHYINSPGIQAYINERKMSVGVPKLAIFRIETMPLLLPPMAIQMKFVQFCVQVNKSKVAVQNALDETQKLFNSLMQQYFG